MIQLFIHSTDSYIYFKEFSRIYIKYMKAGSEKLAYLKEKWASL